MAELQQIEDLGEYLADTLGDVVLATKISNRELTVQVVPESIVKFLTFLRDDVNC